MPRTVAPGRGPTEHGEYSETLPPWACVVPFPPWAGEDNKWWYCDDCSRITADAKLDSSGYYSLSMTCPDGAIEEIDLSDQLVTDRQWIRKQLPTYCRKYCDNLFA